MPNLAVMVDYTYNRTSNLFGNLTGNITPRNRHSALRVHAGAVSPLTGTAAGRHGVQRADVRIAGRRRRPQGF